MTKKYSETHAPLLTFIKLHGLAILVGIVVLTVTFYFFIIPIFFSVNSIDNNETTTKTSMPITSVPTTSRPATSSVPTTSKPTTSVPTTSTPIPVDGCSFGSKYYCTNSSEKICAPTRKTFFTNDEKFPQDIIDFANQNGIKIGESGRSFTAPEGFWTDNLIAQIIDKEYIHLEQKGLPVSLYMFIFNFQTLFLLKADNTNELTRFSDSSYRSFIPKSVLSRSLQINMCENAL